MEGLRVDWLLFDAAETRCSPLKIGQISRLTGAVRRHSREVGRQNPLRLLSLIC